MSEGFLKGFSSILLRMPGGRKVQGPHRQRTERLRHPLSIYLEAVC